jgi:DNA-binding NarL/FixJ family response regulator
MPHNPLEDLPTRFFPVLRGIVGGKHNREIADECGYTEHTVESYASEIYSILGCSGRADLIVRAYRGEFGNLNKLEEVSG